MLYVLTTYPDYGRYYVHADENLFKFVGFGEVYYTRENDDERSDKDFIRETAQAYLDECGLGQEVNEVRRL